MRLSIFNFKAVKLTIAGIILLHLYMAILQSILLRDDKSYLSQLSQDVQTLRSRGDFDVLFIGGSNTAFSISAAQVSDELNIKAYNLGRHASISLEMYVEAITTVLSEAESNPLVVVAPELYAFSATDKISPVSCSLFPYFSLISKLSYMCVGEHTKNALKVLVFGSAQRETDFYAKRYFNEFGDYEYPIDFPQIPIETDVPGNISRIDEVMTQTTLYENIIDIAPNTIFIPVVLPKYHCESNAFDEEVLVSYLDQRNNLGISTRNFTVCADDVEFLDTSYHTTKDLRKQRGGEVVSFLREAMVEGISQ